MTVLVALAGALIGQKDGTLDIVGLFVSLLGIAILISGASALNMYYERVHDRFMTRTAQRPLASGRLLPVWGLIVGFSLITLSLPILFFAGNPLTFGFALLSTILYVWCYTPLKQKTWISLFVGSIPGAMPVMLGYTSQIPHVDQKILALFWWAFWWQVPHFLAISIFRENEYTKAGFIVMPAKMGVQKTKWAIVLTSWFLALSSIFLFSTGVLPPILFMLSSVLSFWYLFIVHRGFFALEAERWAKNVFKATLIYQTSFFLLLLGSAV